MFGNISLLPEHLGCILGCSNLWQNYLWNYCLGRKLSTVFSALGTIMFPCKGVTQEKCGRNENLRYEKIHISGLSQPCHGIVECTRITLELLLSFIPNTNLHL